MNLSKQSNYFLSRRNKQAGAGLIIFFLVLVLAFSTYIISLFDSNSVKFEQDERASLTLSNAKSAVIGYAVKAATVSSSGFLPNPDMGIGTEGSAAGSFSGNAADLSLIGKLPWATLGLPVSKDHSGECIWYVVSGRFKNSPKTAILNWDTQGQIDVIDDNGNIIAQNLAALIVSPGRLLNGQSHVLDDPDFVQCGGNYNAQNYLDSFSASNAIAGEVNYFV